MYFSTTNGTFASSWVLDTSIDAPTEVYVHKALWYPDGWKSVVTHIGQAVEDVQVSTSEDSNYVDIKITGAKLTGKQVDLLLSPPMADSGVLASTEFNAAWTATDLG